MADASGVHHDISFEDYCAIKAINASALVEAETSLKRLRAVLDGKISRDSTAMAFGRALHCRLLEPDRYQSDYRISHGCEALIASGARRGQLCGKTARRITIGGRFACGTHADEDESPNVLTEAEAANVEQAAAAVLAHPVVKLLRQQGGYETTLLYEKDGLPCKARLDKFIPGHPAIVDIKKIRSGRGTRDVLQRDILNYHYDVKAAWYCEAVEILTGTAPVFVWIFVEDSEPFDCRVIQADAETLAIGRHKANDRFYRYKMALETGSWPGYSDEIEWGGLPDFEKDKYRHITGVKK